MAPSLETRRGAMKRKLTLFEKVLAPIKAKYISGETITKLEVINLEASLAFISALDREFDEVQLQIEEGTGADNDKLESEYEQRDKFTTLFAECTGLANRIIKEHGNVGDSNKDLSGDSNLNSSGGVRLPIIDLPKFNGDTNIWLEFKDTYLSLIHGTNLSNIQKFLYLRASLDGDAAKTIEAIALSSDNYDIAWGCLLHRFDNDRLLVHNHVHAIFKIEPMTRECASSLRGINDTLFKHLRSLFSLKQPVDKWDAIIIYLICTKLDKNTVKEWERFRKYKIVVSADINKMYRQILVHPEDRFLQCILWRGSPDDLVSTFALNTVTYGTASAPYLAIRCLKQLATEFESQYPVECRIIRQDFYVDDLLTGFDSVEKAVEHCRNISKILGTACFPLRKWTSNSDRVLNEIKTDEPLSTIQVGHDEFVRTLGIQWTCHSDYFSYKLGLRVNKAITKRAILSDVATIFDPLGFIAPCIVMVKIIIQRLWALQLNWDDDVPDALRGEWLRVRDQLPKLNGLRVDRRVVCPRPRVVEIHGFCDASMSAYGACIYMRSVDMDGSVRVSLLCAKTRVAPIKQLTIPRLELCGALLLSRLMGRVKTALDMKSGIFYWCDSQIVLYWLQNRPGSMQIFVGNRVAEIQTLSDASQWHYVSTKDNPADLASRGVFPDGLADCSLWWGGPEWLGEPQLEVKPFNWREFDETNIPEMRTKVLAGTVGEPLNIIDRYSSLTRLQRVTAYVLRFIHNCRGAKADRSIGELTPAELQESLTRLLRIAQMESFGDEVEVLSNGKYLKPKHKLLGLAPFVDSQGLLRVGGRLRHSALFDNSKHPVLLSGKHPLSRLILSDIHLRLLHAGPQLLLSTMRQNYWPTSGMSAAKMIVRNCVRCCRYRPKFNSPFMGDLPTERVVPASPFNTTGVDYAGPFTLKDRKGRGCKKFKAYLCLFVCFVTKAVHVEVVGDLTTESFIAALRRFVSRRGKPSKIFSDNGTNFIGANKELSLLYELLNAQSSDIFRYCAGNKILWSFSPPNAPNFGGLWESAIKSCKFHLSRAIGDAILTYEEFYTVMVQVEGILNSRPLCPLSSDPTTLEPLTPGHFLLGRPLTTVPDPSLKDIRTNTLSRFQLLQQIQQSFWRRWSKEYLSTLQVRNKWTSPTPAINVGSVVLVKQEGLPPGSWLMGLVEELHPGEDGICRVVSVRTTTGLFKRPTSKLCVLPVDTKVE